MKRADNPAKETGIGARVPRRDLQRLLSGQGRYIDDMRLPRMLHAVIVRSPHPHAEIVSINTQDARTAPGVAGVFTARDINARCEPFIGVAQHRPGHRSPPQHVLADGRAVWQGQPVAIVVARSRAEAEDAAELVAIEWAPLPAVTSGEEALAGDIVIHPELGDNIAFDFSLAHGDSAKAFAEADVVIEETFRFERQMAMTLETRGLIAEYNSGDGSLNVWHAHQSPFQMQEIYSRHLNIPGHKVRVMAPDIGGAFGMKLNVYMDEMAAVVASMILRRPVKFVADRLESFVSDAHARDHVVKARIACSNGEITAMEVDDVGAVGAYGMPMRFNVAEGMMAITMAGAPYSFENYKARTRSVYVNKNLIGMYRGVGMPIACIVAEILTDRAADALGVDTVELKRRTYRPKASLPCVTPGGQRLETISLHECLDKLVGMIDYEGLRREQKELRDKGVYRGLGIGTFLEQTAYGPPYYGPSGAPISTQDGCSVRLEPSGAVRCVTSITDQGQGTLTGIAQIVADMLGVSVHTVGMVAGDSSISTYGGGAWASRGMAAGGEAALRATGMLKENILKLAGAIHQLSADKLDIVAGRVIELETGRDIMSLEEVGRIGYFRQDTLPPDFDVQLSTIASHVHNDKFYYMANGVQASWVEVDPDTGAVRVLRQWAVDDCGRVINPLLVDEQVRGGIAQGIGAVLYEECAFDDHANLLNGTMADYLIPSALDVPDIAVAHVETFETSTRLGAKGIGEAGLIGAMGAVWVAVNDALKPFGAKAMHQPFTPERILDAIKEGQKKSASVS